MVEIIYENFGKNQILKINYINPIDPAVNPTTRKNANSNRSLGREFTNKFN